MKVLTLLSAFCLSTLTAVAEKPIAPVTAETISQLANDGFTQLLGGDSLEGWKVQGAAATYSVKDGVVSGHGTDLKQNSFLCSEKTYKNFVFAFQMKFDHLEGNSGCMFRANLRKDGKVFGYQCEHDNTDRAWTAGIYDESRRGWIAPSRQDQGPSGDAYRKAFTEQGQRLFKKDDWNTIVIKCVKSRIQIWMNGELRVDFTDKGQHQTSEGFFGLQVHSGKRCDVKWKNLFIKELP